MKKRKWTAHQKLQIVLDGMSGKSKIGDLCVRHEMTQSQYYKWRDQLLSKGSSVFDQLPNKRIEKLTNENKQLKNLIGELTVDLKKSERELEWLE